MTAPGKTAELLSDVLLKRSTVCKTGKAIFLLCLAPDSSQLQHSHAGRVVCSGQAGQRGTNPAGKMGESKEEKGAREMD